MASKLKEYRRKRDFSKTREPEEKKLQKLKTTHPIFVVQEHHARRLHYDFRLEIGGVLKSWAVPKGPSLDPSVKRLAVQTEDHPLEYASFEGTIPKGEYGAGEVFIWDHGFWETQVKDPEDAVKNGKIEFNLHGSKLKGRYVLLRTQSGWLLIKKKDEASSAEDEWPGIIPPQLAKLSASPPLKETGWIYEMKLDGYRIQAHIRNGLVSLFTRNGLNWSHQFPFVMNSLGKLKVNNAIFDGEVVALDENGKPQFQLLQNAIKSKKDQNLKFYIFDLLYLNGKDLRGLPLLERKENLKKLLKRAPENIVFTEHVSEGGEEFFKLACEYKLEGIMAKLADSPYLSGRHEFWIKSKCKERQAFIVGGWQESKAHHQGVGSLLLGELKGKKLVYVGKVGTGFSEKTRKDLAKTLGSIESTKSHFEKTPVSYQKVHWVQPVKKCEVAFSEWTKENRLRAPVFLGMHDNKQSTKISSPDKVLFKKDKITKNDLAQFYQTISPVMLPYIAHRPLSVVRCPNGTDNECFFQKHFVGQIPPSFHLGDKGFMSINTKQGLLELVQLNAFEIHTWNCTKDNILCPNQIVMDLDPGDGVVWKQVVQAALELKKLMEDLGLKSFVKLTGGKGLHLHLPILAVYSWEEIKSFSQVLALELVSRHPDRFTSSISKKKRTNKIFIDYLRNSNGATAVAPYSVRVGSEATVAMPLSWSDLLKVSSSKEFNLTKAMAKIKRRKSDPWKSSLKLRQRIELLDISKTRLSILSLGKV